MVDAKHGATIRNSWSIDNSDELGRLEFGASLKYDAVSPSHFSLQIIFYINRDWSACQDWCCTMAGALEAALHI